MASKKINEILECSVCLDRFTRPKVLPCQHTYCYECLLSLAAGGKTAIQCPQCRKDFQIPDPEGVDGFPANLIVNNLLGLGLKEEDNEDDDPEFGAARSKEESSHDGTECCDCKKKSSAASGLSSECHNMSTAFSSLTFNETEAAEGANHAVEHRSWMRILMDTMKEIQLARNVNIRVGDRVRKRQTVTNSRYDWAGIPSASVGIVQSIDGDELVIDFPQSKNCIGVLSEIELVPDVPIKVGDRVRVKQTIEKPRNDWGRVTRGSVGIVRSIEGEKLKIDFPQQKHWNGVLSEMELIPVSDVFKFGDRVRVMQTIETPRNNWGKVGRNSVGIVKFIEGEKLKIDFPEQRNWNGILSEMELVKAARPPGIRVGDKVRVKKTVEKPRGNWGCVTHYSEGVVTSIAGETVKVDFPEQKGWSGVMSEMELVRRS